MEPQPDDAWYFHDERDHAWHTECRYLECTDCQREPVVTETPA